MLPALGPTQVRTSKGTRFRDSQISLDARRPRQLKQGEPMRIRNLFREQGMNESFQQVMTGAVETTIESRPILSLASLYPKVPTRRVN